MDRRRHLAWAPLAVLFVELGVYAVLTTRAASRGVALARHDLPLGSIIAAAAVVMSVTGCFIVSRRPGNAIGWLFALIPLGFWVKGMTDGITFYAHFARHGAIPGGVVAAWMSNWDYLPPIGTLGTFVLLLYPDGRLPSRRWRAVAWLAALAILNAIVATAFTPGRLDSFPSIQNPFGARGVAATIVSYEGAGLALLPLTFLLSALSLWFRARSGSQVLKEQVKWIAFAGALFAVGFATTVAFGFGLVGAFLVFVPVAAFPIASAVAIMRYRLFEIDRVISRTLGYVIVTATLAGAYALVALVPTAVIGTGHVPSGLVAGAVLVVAALFRPVRRRVQNAVDHRFNRARYDATQTIESFTTRLRNEIDMETLRSDLEAVVARTMQPAHVSLWLRDG